MIQKFVRFALIGLIVVFGMAAAGAGYFFTRYPHVSPARDMRIEPTPERLARGRYLSEHVTGCVGCHGTRDWTRYSAPLLPEHAGRGGMAFDLGGGSVLYARNITPAAIGGWSDWEVVRAMTEGVAKDGTALFPLMPYGNYAQMSREDVESVVAYIRTLAPIPQEAVPPRRLPFPLNAIVRTIPAPATLRARAPDPTNRVEYGKYVTTMASCGDCHTPRDDRGQPLPGMTFAGGTELRLHDGTIQHVANITPDPETGIGSWSEETFIQRFKMWADADEQTLKEAGAKTKTDMPWRDFGGMTREDLGAIYAYLRIVPAVRHVVAKP